jgi:hypothetical protein
LLAGYVELADCKFTESQKWYDDLVAKLQPIVNTMDRIRKDKDQRNLLFTEAISRYHEVKQTGNQQAKEKPKSEIDEVLALLRLDPKFLRLNDAVTGMHELANSAPNVVRLWQNLGTNVSEKKVGAVAGQKSLEEEQLADANALVQDLRRLRASVEEQRLELARARRDGTIKAEDAAEETKRLDALDKKTKDALAGAVQAADRAAGAVSKDAAPSIRTMIESDIAEARRLDKAADRLSAELAEAGDKLAQDAIEKLYQDTRKVLDKAKLGKIDAVIGQKRKLDIEVQDLAAGRFPEELIGRMWNASMIGDDEEFWPWEGEFWADEYEGWR